MEEENKFLQTLDWIYEKTFETFGTFDSAYELAEEYLRENNNNRLAAAESLVRNESFKVGGVGFVTGLGGFASMPITLPVNIASALYIQMRMGAAVAVIGGYDLRDKEVKTFIFWMSHWK